MAEITAKAVAELRAKTGCGMMDCKKALVETNGDMEEAVKVLREKGLSVAAKKADRIAAEGLVDILVSEDGKTAAMIEVNSETDFVAKNATFQSFVKELLAIIIDKRPADIDALMQLPFPGTELTVEGELKNRIFTIGEKLTIRRFLVVDGVVSTYVHGAGVTGVIIAFEADDVCVANEGFKEFAKNIALQVAAMPCQYLNKESVPAEAIENEKAILIAQIKNDPSNAKKPDNIIEKMVTGRLGKFYEANCLTEQGYVKDDDLTVQKYVDVTAKAFGGNIALKAFYRYEKGEGIQKREDNFAEEIAKMIK